MYLMTDGEMHGTVSNTVKSSTNLTLGPQDLNRSSTMTANKIERNLVPCGIPPWSIMVDKSEESRQTLYVLSIRNAATHLTKHPPNLALMHSIKGHAILMVRFISGMTLVKQHKIIVLIIK